MLEALASPYPNAAYSQQVSSDDNNAFSAAYDESARASSKDAISPGQAATHAALNVASLVPGEGIAAEFANAGLWASEGHLGHAALDAGLALVPGGHEVGSLAGLLRAGVKIASGGEGIVKAEVEKPNGKSV